MAIHTRNDAGPSEPEPGFANGLRVAGVMALWAGAVGSLAFTIWAGRRNPSRFLIALFVVWVLSPFVGLALFSVASKRRPKFVRTALTGLALLLAVGSLAVYGMVALGPPRPTPAAFFLVVPAASWLLIAVVAALAAILSRRQSS